MTEVTDWPALVAEVRSVAMPGGAEWLTAAEAAVRSDAAAVRTRFAEATRCVGDAPLAAPGRGWTADDAARAVLLHALGDAIGSEIEGLYRFGDAAERRGVLRGLDLLRAPAPVVVVAEALVRDALRTNDPQLVVAALGPFGVSCLAGTEVDHAVMKCVFMDLPLDLVPAATTVPSGALARMLAGFVVERVTAGRGVHPDVWPLIDAHSPSEELAALHALARSDFPERRAAAEAALVLRKGPGSSAGGNVEGEDVAG